MRFFLTILVLAPLLATPASADTIVLALDAASRPANVTCQQPWTQSGVTLEVLPSACRAACQVNLGASTDRLVLVPGGLQVDLTTIPGTVHTVEMILATVILDFEPLNLYNGDVLVASEVADFAFPPDTLTVTSGGAPVTRAVWEPCLENSVHEVLIHFDPQPTAVQLPPELAAAGGSRLLAPTQHPLLGAGTLRFTVGRSASASLLIYDTAGRLVRHMTEGTVAPGLHSVAFDGRDGAGQPLPAGVYFQRLVVDGRPADRGRFVLLR